MRKWIACTLAFLLLCACGVASADWTAPDANLRQYQQTYGEASDVYKTLKYGDEDAAIGTIKETLTELGYYANRISNNFYRSLEIAVRVFAGQARIGGDGREISPLMQAMLADPDNMPRAVSPAIDVYEYSWEPDGNNYTAYTYARISRSGVREDTKVGFSGTIIAAVEGVEQLLYTVQMEDDPTRLVYVSYIPLPRTTVFQVNDVVSVFGVTQGEQSLPFEGMEDPVLLVAADRVGYAP